jgi:hypothetical protein
MIMKYWVKLIMVLMKANALGLWPQLYRIHNIPGGTLDQAEMPRIGLARHKPLDYQREKSHK